MMNNLQSSAQVAKTTQLLSNVANLRLLLVMLLTLTVTTNAWGATKTITITQTALGLSGSYTSTSKTIDGVTFDWTDLMKNSSNIQAKATTGAIWNSSPIPGNIVSVAVTHSGTARSSTMYFGASAKSTTESSTFSGTATTAPEGEYKYFYIKRSSNAAYWTQIVITYETTPAVNHTVTWEVNGENYTTGSPTTSVAGGSKVTTLPTNPTLDCSGRTFVGWSNQEVTDGNKPSVLFTTAENSPAINADTTFYAVFATATGSGSTTDTYDWESTSTGNWTIDSNIARTASQGVSSSYAGKINTANTYVTYTKKVAVTEFSFQFKRTSTNSNYNVYIETSTDNSNWSVAATYAMNSFSNGSYTSKSQTFDGNTELYVRFHCYNTTAVRYVDNVSITYDSSSYSDYTTSCSTETVVTLIPKKRSIGTSLKTYFFL